MASKYGFTVKSIQEMDLTEINKLDKDQMRDALRVMADAANKRAKRLEQAGQTTSFAYQKAKGKGDTVRFKTPTTTDKSQSRNVLYKELTRATEFMNSKTSTLGGWKKTKAKIKDAMTGKKEKANNQTDGWEYAKTEFTDEEFEQLLRDSDFWKFARDLMQNYGFESQSAIHTSTVYSKQYGTHERLKKAISNIMGAEVEDDTIANTPKPDLWRFILDSTHGNLQDMTDPDNVDGWDDIDNEEFSDIWRNN